MGERLQGAQGAERLFFDKRHRELVRELVEKVSEMPRVEKIGVVSLGEKKSCQRLFVFTEGFIPDFHDAARVIAITDDVCKSDEDRKKLGVVPVTTEAEFREDQINNTFGVKISAPVIIWERQPQKATA